MATKSIPHKENCGPCSLCGTDSKRYIHPESMDADTKSLIILCEIEGSNMAIVNCICHACYKRATIMWERKIIHLDGVPKQLPWTEYCGLASCIQKLNIDLSRFGLDSHGRGRVSYRGRGYPLFAHVQRLEKGGKIPPLWKF